MNTVKGTLIKLAISIGGGVVVGGIVAVIQGFILHWNIPSIPKFISNCTFFVTVAYLPFMVYIMLDRQGILNAVRYNRMVHKASKEGVFPKYRTLEEYSAAAPETNLPAIVIWLPMIVALIITAWWGVVG